MLRVRYLGVLSCFCQKSQSTTYYCDQPHSPCTLSLTTYTVPATLLTAAIIFSAQFICLVTIVERLLIEGGYYYIVTFFNGP